MLDISRRVESGMSILPDERGVSEVLGAILVFALVLSVLVIVQVAGVPAANQQIEFEHNARVQGDFQEFDRAVDRAAITGAGESAAIETGVRYPPRLFLLNPGPAAGTVTTSGATPVTIGNVTAVNAEVRDYLNGTREYTTTSIQYTPSYNEYGGAPVTTYENGVLYNSDAGGAAVFDRGGIVSGNRISLTMLEGSISESSSRSVSLNPAPVSAPSKRVSVTGKNGADITISVHTSLSEETWNDRILAEELQSAGGNVISAECQSGVADTAPCDGQMKITLDGTKTYELRLSKVGVGTGYTQEEPAYLTKVGSDTPALQPGGTDLTVELRDEFNTDVSGRDVTFEVTSGSANLDGDGQTKTVTTDENGQATVTVVPTANQSVSVEAFYDSDGDGERDGVTEELLVRYTNLAETELPDTTGDLKDINPQGDQGAILTDVTFESQSKGGGRDRVSATFENSSGRSVEFVDVRISFILAPEPEPTTADLRYEDGGTIAPNIEVQGDYVGPFAGVAIDGPTTLWFDLDQDIESSQAAGTPFDGLLVVTFEAKVDGETEYLTYFMSD